MKENAYLAYLLDCEVYLIDENAKKQATLEPEKKATVIPEVESKRTKEEPAKSQIENTEKRLPPIDFEGSDSAGLVVIVDKAGWNDKQKLLLTKILQSINLKLSETALIKTENTIIKCTELKKIIPGHKRILSFGIQVNMDETTNQPNTISEGGNVIVITSVNLDKLNQDVASKKLLWKNLKQTFNV